MLEKYKNWPLFNKQSRWHCSEKNSDLNVLVIRKIQNSHAHELPVLRNKKLNKIYFIQ